MEHSIPTKYFVPIEGIEGSVVGLTVDNSLLHFDTKVPTSAVMKLVADAYDAYLKKKGIEGGVTTRFSADSEEILTCRVYAAAQLYEGELPSFPPLELILGNKNNGERKNGGSANGGAHDSRQVYVVVMYDVGHLPGNDPRHFDFTLDQLFALLSVPGYSPDARTHPESEGEREEYTPPKQITHRLEDSHYTPQISGGDLPLHDGQAAASKRGERARQVNERLNALGLTRARLSEELGGVSESRVARILTKVKRGEEGDDPLSREVLALLGIP